MIQICSFSMRQVLLLQHLHQMIVFPLRNRELNEVQGEILNSSSLSINTFWEVCKGSDLMYLP
jgi:hypothetical protein